MGVKSTVSHVFRSCLTMISPKLNTEVTYFCKFKKKMDWKNPITLNDKIVWLRFNTYWENQIIKQCADKYRVREWITQKGHEDILPNLIGAYRNVDEINWEELPKAFALKLNVGCGNNIIVSDKSELDIEKTKITLRKWLKSKYYLGHAEMQYKDVEPLILIEEYLGHEDGTLPEDYKFYCMNGVSRYVMLCTDRQIGHVAKFFYYDRNWNKMPYTTDALENPDYVVAKPEGIEKAFEIAEELSKDFPFVRCDLYIVKGKVYFGELTFTPSAGMDVARLSSTDKILGDQLELPKA